MGVCAVICSIMLNTWQSSVQTDWQVEMSIISWNTCPSMYCWTGFLVLAYSCRFRTLHNADNVSVRCGWWFVCVCWGGDVFEWLGVKPVRRGRQKTQTNLPSCVQEPAGLLLAWRWGSKLLFQNMRSTSTRRCWVWPCCGLPAGSLRCPVVSTHRLTLYFPYCDNEINATT